ncbi:hypothetical protein [Pseudomonas sp. PA15(2017)]|uniref:hypothetical protein n=1 Tax=Pseudomonas sp. PA15(2017) TaxID=1932111 RepID=UPI00117B5AE9|nr:hypothetical protein [Pseudomonas sp. PA15(2017)]
MLEKIVDMAVSGIVGNFTYERLRGLLRSPSVEVGEVKSPRKEMLDDDVKEICGSNVFYKNRYRTFDVVDDVYDVIALVKSPMVHIVVEDKPSTAWHLPLVVVEDLDSKEWYVFSKGRMAFEGVGGGLSNSKRFLEFLVLNEIRFSGWVLDYVSSEKLSQGCWAWPLVREKCIPLIAYNKNQYFVEYVVKVFGELSRPEGKIVGVE